MNCFASLPALAILIVALTGGSPLAADPAEVVTVTAEPGSNGWRFSVTLRHGDTGWDDYADGWRIVAPDGTVLGTRVLAHPHVNEQPFTRSQSGIAIPDGLTVVQVQTKTTTTDWTTPGVSFVLPD